MLYVRRMCEGVLTAARDGTRWFLYEGGTREIDSLCKDAWEFDATDIGPIDLEEKKR